MEGKKDVETSWEGKGRRERKKTEINGRGRERRLANIITESKKGKQRRQEN